MFGLMNVFGAANPQAIGNASQSMSMTTMNAGQAQNGYNSPAQSHAHQQQLLYNQQLMAATLGTYQKHWMINGKAMDFNEFVDTICPDKDDPMRTFLILKYKGTK